jgi:ATP-dependent DNA ligase
MTLPRWVQPQLSKLVQKAPTGSLWVHEIKFDGYRMAARIDHGMVRLLTCSGLDWTEKYLATVAALAKLRVKTAYIDGELCGVRQDGVTSFELMQLSSDAGYGGLVHFAFDLLELDGEDVARLPLLERKGWRSCSKTRRAGSSTASMRAATARRSAAPRANMGSKASYPSEWTDRICPEIEGHG